MDPATIVSAVSLFWGVWQHFHARKYRAATSTLVDAIEQAAVANNKGNIKNVVAIQAAADATEKVIDAVLEKKGYKTE